MIEKPTDNSKESSKPIIELTPERRHVSVVFRVKQIFDTRQVKAKFSGQFHLVTDVLVVDKTGQIILTLWDNEIDLIDKEKCYFLKNGYVSLYNHSMRLTKGRFGVLESIDSMIEIESSLKDMSRPFAWKESKKKKHRMTQGKTFTGKRGRESKGYCSRKTF